MSVSLPPNWQNPITVSPGHLQPGVNPLHLLPSRSDLEQSRLDTQRGLQDAGIERWTPIEVTPDGVLWDGHHAVRVAAEKGKLVTVKVVAITQSLTAQSIMDLPVG
jgi:hypothetical protein